MDRRQGTPGAAAGQCALEEGIAATACDSPAFADWAGRLATTSAAVSRTAAVTALKTQPSLPSAR